MSYLIFKLRNVPDDEAEDVRCLLEENNINYYETDSGRFGLGFAAVWMKDNEQLTQAKDLIQQYQVERYQQATAQLAALDKSGERVSRLSFFMTKPIRFSILLVFATALAYFTVAPFFR